MTNHISPGLMMVPYSMDRVEFRRGVWNAESTTLEDDDATGTLWPALDLLSQGLQPPEIVSRVPGLTRAALDDVMAHLASIGALVENVEDKMDGGRETRPVWVFSDDALLAGDIQQILEGEGLQATVLADDTQPSATLFAGLRLEQSADELHMEQEASQMLALLGSAPDLQPLLVVALAQNNPAMLRALDLFARRAHLSWLHAAVDGPALYVGPYVVPGATSSYRTFEQRVAMNLRERQSYLSWMRVAAADRVRAGATAVAASVRAILAAHVAHEAVSIARNGLNTTRNKVLSVYIPTMEIAYNDVLPMSRFDAPAQVETAPDLYYDIREWLAAGGER